MHCKVTRLAPDASLCMLSTECLGRYLVCIRRETKRDTVAGDECAAQITSQEPIACEVVMHSMA